LAEKATFPKELNVRRYDGNKLLAHEPHFQEQVKERYGAPFWGMHRVDLQNAMVNRCSELNVEIRLGCKVASVDFANAAVTISETGERVKGDVILCADGLWSSTRSEFLGQPSPPLLTGDLAYRIVITTSSLVGPDASELRKFIQDQPQVNFWIGPKMHVVAYTMRAGSTYNIVLLCPDDLPPGIAKTDGDLAEMNALFADWDPILRKFLAQVKTVAKWKLFHLEPLSHWGNSEGTFLMLGDSCHPMLPYLAQGANSSLEDGAVVGWLLGRVSAEPGERRVQLPRMREMYEKLRKGRGENIARETWGQREDFHMCDGEAQRERDRLLMEGVKEGRTYPSRWTCGIRQRWLWGYDAYKEVEEAYRKDIF